MWRIDQRSITLHLLFYSSSMTTNIGADCCCNGWSSLLEEMTTSAFCKEPPSYEDEGPGVRGRRPEGPPEPLPGAEAHDLPISGVVEEEGRGEGECAE